ncbi:MAG: hypothetical protein OXC30_00670 [Alphaproteobacteria bacterium]|nr:hypothetical protein [Alphaproteobacteria bacterium]
MQNYYLFLPFVIKNLYCASTEHCLNIDEREQERIAHIQSPPKIDITQSLVLKLENGTHSTYMAIEVIDSAEEQVEQSSLKKFLKCKIDKKHVILTTFLVNMALTLGIVISVWYS